MKLCQLGGKNLSWESQLVWRMTPDHIVEDRRACKDEYVGDLDEG